jgi:hypothetical protein
MLELWIETENEIITETETDNNISETDNNLIKISLIFMCCCKYIFSNRYICHYLSLIIFFQLHIIKISFESGVHNI